MEINLSKEMIEKICAVADSSLRSTRDYLRCATKNKESYAFRGDDYLADQQAKIDQLKARVDDAKEVKELFDSLLAEIE